MKFRTKILALTAAGGILAAGAVAVLPVGAQDGDDPPAVEEQDSRDEFLARVAGKLGVDASALEQAMQDVQLELVDEALAAGRINEEQAAKARERIESGKGPGFGRLKEKHGHGNAGGGPPGHAFGHERGMKVRGALLESAAAAIGISKDELKAEMKDGASIADVAAANGVSVDDVKARITADTQAKLAEAVGAGKLDQVRADEALARLSERLDDLLNKKRDAPAQE